MARYIDAEKLEQEFKDNVPKHNAIINGSEYPAFVVDHTLHKIRNFPPADVAEVKDCSLCVFDSRHATEYPCSHCKNCYLDKFKPIMDGGKAE